MTMFGDQVLNREARRQLARENNRLPTIMTPVPEENWPGNHSEKLVAVWRSRNFVVQAFTEQDGILRLSVNRSSIDVKAGRWNEAITWDELQLIKTQCGYGGFDAVEVYPADKDIINVANMRHLWIMPEQLAFKWRK